MAHEGINFSFDSPHALPTDEMDHSYDHEHGEPSPPPQEAEGSESYLCGDTGNAHPYANPGRDQDRSRADEFIAAQAFARYVS